MRAELLNAVERWQTSVKRVIELEKGLKDLERELSTKQAEYSKIQQSLPLAQTVESQRFSELEQALLASKL